MGVLDGVLVTVADGVALRVLVRVAVGVKVSAPMLVTNVFGLTWTPLSFRTPVALSGVVVMMMPAEVLAVVPLPTASFVSKNGKSDALKVYEFRWPGPFSSAVTVFGPPFGKSGTDVTLTMRIDDSAITATLGPFGAEVAEELRATDTGLGLRRVLETTVDEVDVSERDGSQWVQLRKAIARTTDGG